MRLLASFALDDPKRHASMAGPFSLFAPPIDTPTPSQVREPVLLGLDSMRGDSGGSLRGSSSVAVSMRSDEFLGGQSDFAAESRAKPACRLVTDGQCRFAHRLLFVGQEMFGNRKSPLQQIV